MMTQSALQFQVESVYTAKLTEYIIEEVKTVRLPRHSLLIQALMYFTGVSILTMTGIQRFTMDDVNAYMATLSPEESAQMQAMTSGMSDDQILQLFLSVTKG